jgi:hypothetical protein
MTAQDGLERRYRRLLAAYPWRHRQVYEEEMVGVLLAEAEPGQRRPRPAESADLLMSAVAVRLRSGFDGLRDDDWRPAAYAVQVFGALFLLAVAFRRVALDATALVVLRHQAPGFFAEAWLYTAGWALVLAATLLQWRRSAAALATMAATIEVVRVASWYDYSPSQVLRNGWLVTVSLVVVVAAVRLVRGPVPARPRGLWTGAVAAVLMVGAGCADVAQNWFLGGFVMTLNDVFMIRIGAPLYLVAALLAVVVAVRLPAPVRRRVVVFATPVATIVLMVTYGFAGFMYSSQQFPQPILLTPVQWVVLLGAPVLAFVLAAVAVQAYERQLQLIALGRDAERRAHRDPAGRA